MGWPCLGVPLQVGADQLSDSARTTLERHGWSSNTFIRQQATRAGADITLIVVPAWLPGRSIGYHPMRSHLMSVRNGRRPLEWAIGVIKADALGSYVPLSILGFTFGLLSNQEVTPPGLPYHAHSWAPWCVRPTHVARPWLKCCFVAVSTAAAVKIGPVVSCAVVFVLLNDVPAIIIWQPVTNRVLSLGRLVNQCGLKSSNSRQK